MQKLSEFPFMAECKAAFMKNASHTPISLYRYNGSFVEVRSCFDGALEAKWMAPLKSTVNSC